MEVWTAVLLIISALLVLVIMGAIYRYYKNNRAGRALIRYNTADNYSDLGSEIKFKDSKNTKVWIGQKGLGNIILAQKHQYLREQKEAYAVAMKIAKNWCNLSNMMDAQNERKMADELPCIGHRQFSKFYHPMYDEKYGSQRITQKKIDSKRLLLCHYDSNQLPVLNNKLLTENEKCALGKCRIFDFQDEEQYRAFRLIFETLEHPYILRTYEINMSADKRHIFIIRDLEKEGSLRDIIHGADLSSAYGEKYCKPGKALYVNRIRKYGRQILEGINYLSACGIVNYHLHSGNVIIQNDNAKLSEIENLFFGYQLRHPLHQHLQAVKKIYADLDVEVCLFGYILFEMATGIESPTPSPLDYLHELPRKLDRSIINLLGRIFGDKSFGGSPKINDLINDPLFNATNVPRGDVSLFVALKNENEMVDKLRNAVLMQCYYTYSTEALLGEKVSGGSKSVSVKKKKKKKKKKKREKLKEKKQKNKQESEEPLVSERNINIFEDEKEKEEDDIFDDRRDRKKIVDDDNDLFGDEEDIESSGNDPWSSQ